MPTYRKKQAFVDAHAWWKNGDHPKDGDERHPTEGWLYEGQIVRRFRHPHIPGQNMCLRCGHAFNAHGWLDPTRVKLAVPNEEGLRVCPGDWVLEHPFTSPTPGFDVVGPADFLRDYESVGQP